MKKYIHIVSGILIILVMATISSCQDANLDNPVTPVSTIVEPSKIDKSQINPAALEYYGNIAEMADWYASHPTSRLKNDIMSKSANKDSVNVLLNKLEAISIVDSTNTEKTIFELNSSKRKVFLESFVTIEASELSKKIALDTTKNALATIVNQNEVYKEATTELKATSRGASVDPYWYVRKVMDRKEQESAKESVAFAKNTLTAKSAGLSPESQFWMTVVANGFLSSRTIFGAAPPYLPATTFINRIRPSVARGRLLIALPGGTNTWSPVVVYPLVGKWDVGHVAVISKDRSELPSYIDGKSKITIGTSTGVGMRDEEIAGSWSDEHGLAFVGQVYDVSWQWYYRRWYDFGFRRVSRDVNNTAIYNSVASTLGSKYCYWYEIPFAKWAAPSRFICSSSAWWAAKSATGVNIGDWWKPTILPAGVYLSDRVRIIDNTFY